MGQARRRGTFEERRHQAIIRDEANSIRAIKKEIARRANMSEEEKRAEHEYNMLFCSYMGIALSSLSNWNFPYKI